MLKKILNSLNDVLLRLISSLRRFPEPLVLAFAIVIILIIANHSKFEDDVLIRAAMALALGVPLFLSIRMLFERNSVRKLTLGNIYILSALLLILYYNYLLPETNMVSMTRFLALNLALYLLFIVIPYIGRKEGFEIYIIKLAIGFIVTYFYSLILFIGLAAILFTINTLFSANIPSEVYFDLFLIVAGIFAPAYFLAGIPAYGVTYGTEEYPTFLRILLLYIVMPLLSIYTIILYVYFIKIIVTQYWPAGIVSHLVLWYSLISTVVIVCIYLLKEKNAWVKTFIKYFPKLILPLLIMMFVAMGIRIDAYGITENRYLVMAGGLWTTGSMLYFAFKKETRNIKIVLSAAIIAVLVVSGPWSAYSISKASQNTRFEELLNKNGMLVNENIVASQSISHTDKVSISSIILYFNDNHDLKDLKLLPQGFVLSDMRKTFGFDLTYSSSTQYFSHRLSDSGKLLNVQDYDYFLFTLDGLQNGIPVKLDPFAVYYDSTSFTIKITREGQVIYEKDLRNIALDIHSENIGEYALPYEQMTFVEENEHVKVLILFNHMSGNEVGEDGKPDIDWLECSVLFKAY